MSLDEMIESAVATGRTPEAAARLILYLRERLLWSDQKIIDRIRVVFPELTAEEICEALDAGI